MRLFKNAPYCIQAITHKSFTVQDVLEKGIFTFSTDKLENFILPYANTCYSVQGLSIDGPITIFDVNAPQVDRFYVWTALTRARDLSQVTIFEHSKSEVSRLEKGRIKRYLEDKVLGYKRQDKNAGRCFKKNDFITADWIADEHERVKERCDGCGDPFEFVVAEGNVTTNLTVDRIDNSKAHIKSNSCLKCLDCNRARSNHY